MARFAILAYAPSLHSKHAVIAALSAYELRDSLGSRWSDLLIEVARYAAETRQPWSDAPILDPPAVDSNEPRDLHALRNAIDSHDRPAAERWLAARLDDCADDLLTVAAEHIEAFLLTAAALKLSTILGNKGRYAALRIAIWDMLSAPPTGPSSPPLNDLRSKLLASAIAEKGSIESVNAVFLYDAAKNSVAFERVSSHLSALELKTGTAELPRFSAPAIYRLARDYGQHLRACAIGDERLKPATAYNLANAPSFADWSFA